MFHFFIFLFSLYCHSRNFEFVGGNVFLAEPGLYDAMEGNMPGSRSDCSSFSNGNDFYIYGGWGLDAESHVGDLRDLWKYSTDINKWFFLSGSNKTQNWPKDWVQTDSQFNISVFDSEVLPDAYQSYGAKIDGRIFLYQYGHVFEYNETASLWRVLIVPPFQPEPTYENTMIEAGEFHDENYVIRTEGVIVFSKLRKRLFVGPGSVDWRVTAYSRSNTYIWEYCIELNQFRRNFSSFVDIEGSDVDDWSTNLRYNWRTCATVWMDDIKGMIYYFGGYDDETGDVYSDIAVYNLTFGDWASVFPHFPSVYFVNMPSRYHAVYEPGSPDLVSPSSRYDAKISCADGFSRKCFLFGGFDSNDNAMSGIWVFDLDNPSWTFEPLDAQNREMNHPEDLSGRWAPVFLSTEDESIFLFGGQKLDGTTRNDLWVLLDEKVRYSCGNRGTMMSNGQRCDCDERFYGRFCEKRKQWNYLSGDNEFYFNTFPIIHRDQQPAGRIFHPFWVLGNDVYVGYGEDNSGNLLGDLWQMKQQTDRENNFWTWISGPKISDPNRFWHQPRPQFQYGKFWYSPDYIWGSMTWVVQSTGSLFVFGGFDPYEGEFNNMIFEFRPEMSHNWAIINYPLVKEMSHEHKEKWMVDSVGIFHRNIFPEARRFATANYLEDTNTVLILGGCSDESSLYNPQKRELTSFLEYSYELNEYRFLPIIPERMCVHRRGAPPGPGPIKRCWDIGRRNHVGFAMRGKFYVFGGIVNTGQAYTSSIWVFDHHRYNASAENQSIFWTAIFDDKLIPDEENYLLSKTCGEQNAQIYDNYPSARGWSQGFFDAVQDEFYIFGGELHGAVLSDMWAFSTLRKSWRFVMNSDLVHLDFNCSVFNESSMLTNYEDELSTEWLHFCGSRALHEIAMGKDLVVYLFGGMEDEGGPPNNRLWTFDQLRTECSKHGELEKESCRCHEHYSGEFCSVFSCFGRSYISDSVCTGHGYCIQFDECLCHEVPGFNNAYRGEECEKWNCWNVQNDNVTGVCNNKGVCFDLNQCACDLDWYGRNCDENIENVAHLCGSNNNDEIEDGELSFEIPYRVDNVENLHELLAERGISLNGDFFNCVKIVADLRKFVVIPATNTTNETVLEVVDHSLGIVIEECSFRDNNYLIIPLYHNHTFQLGGKLRITAISEDSHHVQTIVSECYPKDLDDNNNDDDNDDDKGDNNNDDNDNDDVDNIVLEKRFVDIIISVVSGVAGLVGLCICGLVVCLVILSIHFYRKRAFEKKVKALDIDILLEEKEMELLEKNNRAASFKINSKVFEIDYKSIKLHSAIGMGGSGTTVFKATWNDEVVAFKLFKICFDDMSIDFEEFEKEIQVQIKLNHPSIIHTYGACFNPPRVGIVMELASYGTLKSYVLMKIEEESGGGANDLFDFDARMKMMKQVASGICYLHSQELIHRDIKPENVLIFDNHVPKIMDFGLCRILDRRRMTKFVGTPRYMAKECYTTNYGKEVDVFALGVMILEVLTGDFSSDFPIIIERLRKEFGEGSEGDWVVKLVENMIEEDPVKRPKIEEVCAEISKFFDEDKE